MGIWETFFGQAGTKNDFANKLHEQMATLIPDLTEKEQIHVACLAGLLARVTYVDLNIHQDEEKHMIASLLQWGDFEQEKAQAITQLALQHIKDLSGLENHLYCVPLSEDLSTSERFNIVTCLFALAAADGSVGNQESEEIRNINQGLLLEHKHYISARAQVIDKLAALNKNP